MHYSTYDESLWPPGWCSFSDRAQPLRYPCRQWHYLHQRGTRLYEARAIHIAGRGEGAGVRVPLKLNERSTGDEAQASATALAPSTPTMLPVANRRSMSNVTKHQSPCLLQCMLPPVRTL